MSCVNPLLEAGGPPRLSGRGILAQQSCQSSGCQYTSQSLQSPPPPQLTRSLDPSTHDTITPHPLELEAGQLRHVAVVVAIGEDKEGTRSGGSVLGSGEDSEGLSGCLLVIHLPV